MRSFLKRFLLLMGLFSPIASIAAALAPPAAAPVNPYEAVVPVTDTSPTGQSAALREALATVLGAVTGLPDVRTRSTVIPILDQAAELVQSYGTERDPTTKAPMFRAAFDARAVDAALKRQGLPVFGLIAGTEQDWPVVVHGVGTFRDYARTLDALRRVRGVRNVAVQSVDGDALNLQVRFEGDAFALARGISASGSLRAAGESGAQLAGQLVYTFVSTN